MKNNPVSINRRSRRAFALILIPLCFTTASSHRQAVHQYIAREAYSLLVKARNSDIPELSPFIGLVEKAAAGDSAWQMGSITAGAWREDDEDVVFHYDILPGFNYALTSITHFWSADRGDMTENTIRLQIDRPPLPPISMDIGPYQNALDKMMKFADGGWVLNYPRAILCQNTANDHWLAIAPLVSVAGFGIPLTYAGLARLYTERKLTVRADQANLCVVFDANDLTTIPLSSVPEIRVDDHVRNTIVWEILGRMCHLLGDMSVPAHAHLDEHGLNPDSYEDFVGGAGDPYMIWSAENSGPALQLHHPGNEDLHFLMYTMQQQADHFGSNGPANGNGNDVIGGSATQAERDRLNAIDLSSIGGPTTDAGPWTIDQMNIIKDRTIPYAIRATAGLLHWFCITTGIIPGTGLASDGGASMPISLHLAQNFPNPFNSMTVVRYQLPMTGDVMVAVYDLLGREVAVLEDERKTPGSYEVKFDATGLSTGVYLCRLTVGQSTRTRTMLLLR